MQWQKIELYGDRILQMFRIICGTSYEHSVVKII
ncbi:unnamed protein product [Debaryomyces tyrocola]|nr:unnamed protein product [Debaryomyces tyrocola]